jgi:hypothetical protein
VSNIVTVSGIIAATGGPAGSTGNTAVPANTGTTSTTLNANAIFLNLGTFQTSIGQSGGQGLGIGNGAGVSVANLVTGGGGGAGTEGVNNRSGGPITATGAYVGISTSVIAGTNGTTGLIIYKPMLSFTGGAGGTSNIAGIGGNGGNGAYGSGGGGGAGGTTGAGNGGRGGDGIVIITTSF